MINDIKINILIKKDKGNLLANANVSIPTQQFGIVTLKDFQIWKSSIHNERLADNINIQPPGIMIYGHFRSKAFFEDKESWYRLEFEIYQSYTKILSKLPEEEINIDEIPI